MTPNRNARASTLAQGRQYAIGVDGTVITFECARSGHTYTVDMGRGPRHRRMGAAGCRMMASWWSRAKGGCIGDCPKCQREPEASQ